ncbi:hypothetical protein V6N11_018924 [Hibiscus sabdariffa]|uniref:TIR domain-containing protein n=1 Tax=Hibiscus sabdariffa TaxID=183260 RepID=A0ABR2R0T3_9ROSI
MAVSEFQEVSPLISRCSYQVFLSFRGEDRRKSFTDHLYRALHVVLPVFYDVDPGQVRNQTGSYAAAFARHEESFKSEMSMVQRWRTALKEIADLGGFVLQDSRDSSKLFEVKELNFKESLQLFSWYAIGRNSMPENFMEYGGGFVKHCGGLPLALQVLGSSLSGKSMVVWRNALEKLEVIPASKIQKILRISYDSL